MKLKVSILIAGFLFDSLLASLFPNDFTLQAFAFVANSGFLITVLMLRKMEYTDKVLHAALIGLLYGLFFSEVPILYAGIYVLVAHLIQYWEKQMMDSFFEQLMLLISTLFIKDVVLYIIFYIFLNYRVSLMEWFVMREFLTLLGNIILGVVLIIVFRWVEDTLEIKNQRIRRKEKIHMFR
ncbi:MAG: hypothetical protein ACRCZJ_01270 [Erysipelotrichaceae bacterium]